MIGIAREDTDSLPETTTIPPQLRRVLRKTGRVDRDNRTYPRVVVDGTRLEFCLPHDRDGNGLAIDEITGEVEWSPNVYSVELRGRRLSIYRDDDEVLSLLRGVHAVQFRTGLEDESLHPREISISIDLHASGGNSAASQGPPRLAGAVFMRN